MARLNSHSQATSDQTILGRTQLSSCDPNYRVGKVQLSSRSLGAMVAKGSDQKPKSGHSLHKGRKKVLGQTKSDKNLKKGPTKVWATVV